MAARIIALHARDLLQDAVAPDLWSTAAAHSSSQGGSSSSGSGGGGISGLIPSALAPGPEAAVNVNSTDGASAGAVNPYMATPDTVVIILGVAAIVLTLTAIGLRLYRSDYGCCCGRRVVAQPTSGPAPGQAQQRAAKLQQQTPPVIVVMPNEELLCAVKDGAPKPAPPKLLNEEAAGDDPALEGDSRLDPGLLSERRRRQQRRDAEHVPAWWVFDALSWAAPRLLLPAAPRPGMQREQAAAAKGESGSFCYII